MSWLGDFSTGSTVFFAFTTVNSTGAPTALSSGGVTVYKNNSTVPNTTGLTLTASHNAVTGLNLVQVDMAGTSTFYAPGACFMAVVSSGAIGAESPIGYVVGQWSVKDRGTVTVSTAVLVSTAVSVSTAATIASVASVVNAVSISTGSVIDSVTSVTGNVTGSIGSLTTAAALQVNAEVVDAINVDTYAEPSGVPSTLASLVTMNRYLYSAVRNPVRVSSSAKTFYTAGGTFLFGKTLSQDSTSSTGVYAEAVASTST